MSMIMLSKAIGPIPVSVIMKETHTSTIAVTENPIETGAKVTDHAYIEPKKLVLEFVDANATATYNALVRLQETRMPFTVVSGLYLYRNMVIVSLTANRDNKTSRILDGRVELREVIIVSTAYTVVEGSDQSSAGGKAGGAQSTRAATPSAANANNAATANRAAGTAVRGDSPMVTPSAAENRSILSRVF